MAPDFAIAINSGITIMSLGFGINFRVGLSFILDLVIWLFDVFAFAAGFDFDIFEGFAFMPDREINLFAAFALITVLVLPAAFDFAFFLAFNLTFDLIAMDHILSLIIEAASVSVC